MGYQTFDLRNTSYSDNLKNHLKNKMPDLNESDFLKFRKPKRDNFSFKSFSRNTSVSSPMGYSVKIRIVTPELGLYNNFMKSP